MFGELTQLTRRAGSARKHELRRSGVEHRGRCFKCHIDHLLWGDQQDSRREATDLVDSTSARGRANVYLVLGQVEHSERDARHAVLKSE